MGLRSGRHELEVTMDPAPKRLAFLGQYSGFVKFLAKVLYSPRKTIFFCKSAVLSKKTKKNKQSFPVSESARSQDLKRLVFFWTVQHCCKKRLVFWGQYSVFVKFLAKVLYCSKKKQSFCAVLSQK